MTTDIPIVVIFGRPGAGKSTVADAAMKQITSSRKAAVVALDLDVCVPQWMKDDFANGIYPTLAQRREFAFSACDYVDSELARFAASTENSSTAAIISFSFVNVDLRDIFRERFPHAAWALMDVKDHDAKKRIEAREGHFYKGSPPISEKEGEESDADIFKEQQRENSEKGNDDDNWAFAAVSFPHIVLDGTEDVEVNAEKVVEAFDDYDSIIK